MSPWLIKSLLFTVLAQAEEPIEEIPEIEPSGGPLGVVFLLVMLAVAVIVIAGCWKDFAKAGQPGWGILIPIYNVFLMCKIGGRPGWWTILYFIPGVNFIIGIVVSIDIAKAFGQGTGFGLGLAFLPFIFIPVLGFGGAAYQGAGNMAAVAAA
jgi:hypothetical protein